MLIRDFADRDIGPANDLTNHYIAHTPIHFATEQATHAEFSELWRKGVSASPAYPWFVAEVEGSRGEPVFAGYAKASEFRSRAAYRGTAECGIYIGQAWQGRGIGKPLYRELLRRLGELGYHRAVAGISLPNKASVRLHEAVGFTHVGTFREVGRKFDAWHDVGFWERSLECGSLHSRDVARGSAP